MKCTEFLNNLRFNPDSIASCSYNRPGILLEIKDINTDYNKSVELYKNQIQDYCQNLQNEIIPVNCDGCVMLAQNKNNTDINCDNKKHQITTIDISHWYYCNINCVYCCFKHRKREMPSYNVLKFIELLKDNIADDCIIRIGGGEPSVLPELSGILNFFKDKNNVVYIMSNMTIFKDEYIPLLKSGQLHFTVSVDCGNKLKYAKIKQHDKFDIVVENLKKCLSFARDTEQITLQYIITEGYNDTKQDLDEFNSLSKILGIKFVHYIFDRQEDNIGKKIPKHILELYAYAKSEAPQNNLTLDYDTRSEEMEKQGFYI